MHQRVGLLTGFECDIHDVLCALNAQILRQKSTIIWVLRDDIRHQTEIQITRHSGDQVRPLVYPYGC